MVGPVSGPGSNSMEAGLRVSIGQFSDKGRKPVNQDFHGALIPLARERALKGVSIVIADGISSSTVSQIAAESAVKLFLMDYYCTSETWSVKTSGYRVLAATNSWLHAQTRRVGAMHDQDRGYVCTFSAMVIKSITAHIFHVGDARIYRVAGTSLEQLTTDHRVTLSSEQSYLGRALGVNQDVEIDYQAIPVATGDVFILATDGVYEHIDPALVIATIKDNAHNLDAAARRLVEIALQNDSTDNLTAQIVRIDQLPNAEAAELFDQAADLEPAPLLDPPTSFDGYRILRALSRSSRSHVYLAEDIDSGERVVMKIPSIDLRGDPAYLKRFMMEEWAARRISNVHVLRPALTRDRRSHLYTVMEYVDGQTLAQWMIDHPKPDLEIVRDIIEQIAKGLQAFHRKDMLHQDLRPENIMIEHGGTVHIIDFGSVRIAGVMEATPDEFGGDMLGTAQYTAPEYLLGQSGTELSDLYALGVITYQMLTGSLPYGARMAQARTRAQQRRVAYTSVSAFNRNVPAWIDAALRKAVHPDPDKRQMALSEFLHDLRHPREGMLGRASPPLMERHPVRFWQGVSAILFALLIVLAMWR